MKTYFVDSFTNEKYKGNPAAVCIVEGFIDEKEMQSIATEIGFSETAFIKQRPDERYDIRFFTPKLEIALCGHATLASSKVIFETTNLQSIRFLNINSIELLIEKSDDKIKMQFPVYETQEVIVPQKMLDALGILEIENQRYNADNKMLLLEIKDTKALADLLPDFFSLLNSYQGINGVVVTAKSESSDFDFHYRFFWPWAGTNEDPVTGVVQTFLTKYWATKLNKNHLNSFQSSARTGKMTTEFVDDTVFIYGEAVTVFEGEFRN